MAETHKLRTSDILPKTETFQNLNSQAETLAKNCPSAPLPALDHLRMADYDVVYEPSDDTYLMVDALGWDFDHSTSSSLNRSHANITLEIGCGTGVNTIFLAKLLQAEECKMSSSGTQQQRSNSSTSSTSNNTTRSIHIVTDINPNAIRITKQTAQQNNIIEESMHYHQCDIAKPLLETYPNKIDVILFNPPYVPTPNEEVGTNDIEASWAGGIHGRVVIDRALPQIASLLSKPHGVAYMITVDDNKPEEIACWMRNEYGIRVEPYLRRRARNEFLTVLKMTHCLSNE